MKKIAVCDITLREGGAGLGFREKLEVIQLLDRTGVDVIETEPFTGSRTDVLFLHTVAPLVRNAVLSCPVKLTEESVDGAWEAIRAAARPRLHVMVPVSTVQMEYLCRKKPDAVLAMTESLIGRARALCPDVEFSAIDATRADPAFLKKIIAAAIAAGASTVCLCDSVGTMLPAEADGFFRSFGETEGPGGVRIAAAFSDASGLGCACAVSALQAGVTEIKTAVGIRGLPSLEAVAAVFRARGDALGCETALNHTMLTHACEAIFAMLHPEKGIRTPAPTGSAGEDFTLNREDDIQTVAAAVLKLGYELSSEEMAGVFENFQRLSRKKPIGRRELEAIVAGSAVQSAPVYKLKSYVITTGNLFSSSAQICLEKDGRELHGIRMGDGPIDASFLAIESIVGHHFELDDFIIRSVTEGREAMGEAIVKLRKGGKLYSGRGLSTDIIGSSIHAFLNALNKICSEEV